MIAELSRAEMRVAEAICKGYTVKEAADALFVSPETVKSTKRNIFMKLNVKKETELIMLMVCNVLGKKFSIKELRERGVSMLLSLLFLVMALNYSSPDDMRQMRARRAGRRYEQVIGGTDDGGQDDDDE